jgi:L-erythro-3,5-diaminohexanoate dehydrogenase
VPLAERSQPGHPLGLHRVLDAKKRLPQAAEKIDNTLPIYPNEILLDVERLNIDAASFVQMEKETGGDPKAIAAIVQGNCEIRGKQQNKVTGSGGMLVGKVLQIGSAYQGPLSLKVGDRVASLISLTLTPLKLDAIKKVHLPTHQMEVKGTAVLFESSIAAKLPTDLPEALAMAVYDVAGAPATVDGLCEKGDTVVLLGAGGKAGVLSCVAARNKIGPGGKLIGIEPGAKAAEDLRGLGVCDAVLQLDATDSAAVHSGIHGATHGKMGDVVVNVVSVPDTEMSAILSANPRGKVLFFGMATSFTKVALGAEGVASSATLLFGNGYYPNHAEFAISLLRKSAPLKDLFLRRYGAA